MITYVFRAASVTNLSTIVQALESGLGLTLHTSASPSSTPTYINGYVASVCTPSGCVIYVNIFDSAGGYVLTDSSGNVIYAAQPPSTTPSYSQVAQVLSTVVTLVQT
mgnify:CR=1 FL=1